MRALVTGVAGFAGSHLAEYLLTQGMEVVGLARPGTRLRQVHFPIQKVQLIEVDLLDREDMAAAVAEAAPDLAFHLAAQAAVSRSWQDTEATLRTNILGQLHLFEAIIAAGLQPRTLVVGSDEEYGLLRYDELPATEESPFRPVNPYGVSKVTQDLMGYQYFVSHKLPVIRVRPFNHIGPHQADAFVTASFAKQIAETELGQREPVIRVGNLEVGRDFTDVRDIVRGYFLALTKGEPGEVYNLASGQLVTIRRILDLLLEQAKASLTIESDPSRFRPADVEARFGSYAKIKARTGWEPLIPLETSLADVLEYWRYQVAGSKAAS